MIRISTPDDLNREVFALLANGESITISSQVYLDFVSIALDIKQKYPRSRAEIAYVMTSLGSALSNESKNIKEIKDLFADLELPDGHIDISDGLDVGQKWDKLAKVYQNLCRLPRL